MVGVTVLPVTPRMMAAGFSSRRRPSEAATFAVTAECVAPESSTRR